MKSGGGKLVVLFIVLLALTVGISQVRFTFGDEELLPNLDLSSGLDGWVVWPRDALVTAENGEIVLRQDDFSQFIVVAQSLEGAERFSYLRISGEIKAENIVQGERFWQHGRVVLVGRDADDRAIFRRHHVLGSARGDSDWASYEAVFKVAARAVQIQVSVELPRASGQFRARNLSLRAAEQAAWFPYGGLMLVAGWIAAAFWASGFLVNGRRGAGWRRPVLAVLLLLAFVQMVPQLRATRFVPMLPVGFVDISGGVVVADITQDAPRADATPGTVLSITERATNGGAFLRDSIAWLQFRLQRLDLVAHLVGFLVLAGACVLVSGAGPLTVMPYLFAAALAGEVGQWSVQGEYSKSDLTEIAVDFAGVIFLSLILWRRRQRE